MGEIASVIIHIFAYGRIWHYKKCKNEIGPQTFSSFQRKSVLSRINTQSLTSIGVHFLILFSLVTLSFSMIRINSTKLEDIAIYPNYLYVYYNTLIAPGLISTLFVVLIFKRNIGLRKTVLCKIETLLLNAKEHLAG